MRAILALILAGLLLAGCGKRAQPTAPGPSDQITWPRAYPSK